MGTGVENPFLGWQQKVILPLVSCCGQNLYRDSALLVVSGSVADLYKPVCSSLEFPLASGLNYWLWLVLWWPGRQCHSIVFSRFKRFIGLKEVSPAPAVFLATLCSDVIRPWPCRTCDYGPFSPFPHAPLHVLQAHCHWSAVVTVPCQWRHWLEDVPLLLSKTADMEAWFSAFGQTSALLEAFRVLRGWCGSPVEREMGPHQCQCI